MQTPEAKTAQKKQDIDVISVRRNPYLVDYEEERRLQRAVNEGQSVLVDVTGAGSRRASEAGNGRVRRSAEAARAKRRRAADEADVPGRRPAGRAEAGARRTSDRENKRARSSVEIIDTGNRRTAGAAGGRSRRSVEMIDTGARRTAGAANGRSRRSSVEIIDTGNRRTAETANRRTRRTIDERELRNKGASGRRNVSSGRSVDLIDIGGRQPRPASAGRRRSPAAAKKAAMKRRRKQILRRRMMLGAWTLCFIMTGWLILLTRGRASEAEQENDMQEVSMIQEEAAETSSTIVQGLSADIFAGHPAWEENFLPVNEYSRPGEPLPAVNDIFVHYTANPGTSAAQNRSYFEQQKDMHEASVSAHFIIGYDGEIIQCVPLDEIAYAVQTRNYDSISIECCYKAADGSFTQETYDSLILLLAWLTDAYGLDTSHILRHYDCGGKKCPVYYTEHEDAWARLKEDVAAR